MNNKSYSEVFDAAAGNHIPDRTDLAPRILTHIQKGKGAFMQPKLKLLMLALAVITVFIILLANGPAVVRALQNLFGYIPGVGVVETDGSLRTLAEPVRVTKESVTISVEQGSVDSKKTILSLHYAGLDSIERTGVCSFEEGFVHLRLSDDVILELTDVSASDDGESRYYFPPLPIDSNQASLELGCPFNTPSLKDWVFPLRFVRATGLKPFPVFEVSSATPGAQTSLQSLYDIRMTLEQVVPLDDGYIFMGNMKWDGGEDLSRFRYWDILYVAPDSIQVVDANGQELQGKTVPPGPRPDSEVLTQQPWALQVFGKELSWPLKLTVRTLQVSTNAGGYLDFGLDLGPNPQVGQTWILDQDVIDHMPYGHDIHLNSATWTTDPETGRPWLQFDVQSDPDVLDITFYDSNSDGSFISRGSDNVPPGHLGIGIIFTDDMPTGKRWFHFFWMNVLVHGDWQITWQP